MNRDISWIAAVTDGTVCGKGADTGNSAWQISNIQTDSRLCTPGSLYIARQGENGDGHDYLEAAVKNGAVAAIVERGCGVEVPQIKVGDATVALGKIAAAHLRQLREVGQITVIGITGSAGKTTTKDMLGQLLLSAGKTVFPEKSFNNEVGCPLTILRADVDTRYLVLEMGASGAGHLNYLTEIAPLDIAVVLMVGKAHLGGFGSEEGLAAAKAELVQGLLPGGTAILNADDPNVAKMAALANNIVFFSSRGNPAQLVATDITLGSSANACFTLQWQVQPGSEHTAPIQLSFAGSHQVTNALAAGAAALTAGLSFSDVAKGLSQVGALSEHRMNVIRDGNWDGKKITVIDDAYNANPDSMIAGLDAAATLAGSGRLIAVLGEMLELGDQSADLHRQVGEHLLRLGPARVITLGSNAAEITQMLKGRADAQIASNSAEAFRMLAGDIADGDTVFLKGSYGSNVWQIADQIIGVMNERPSGQEKNEV